MVLSFGKCIKTRCFSHTKRELTHFSVVATFRITELGDVPPDNPYVQSNGVRCNETGQVPIDAPDDAVCSEIFALGLRNPFRLAMDPNTKDKVRFYIGDVGGKAWEEINECGTDFAGVNYGYPLREGPCELDSDTLCDVDHAFQDPAYWYAHRRYASGGAITGGTFVPNGVWPAEYDNTYMYADFTFGSLYNLKEGGEDCRTCSPPTTEFKNTTFHDAIVVVDMFFGPCNGTQALYFLSMYDNSVRRVRYTGIDNRSPVAVLKADPITVLPGEPVQFNASESFDPDGSPLTFHWQFGDGTESNEVAPIHVYELVVREHVELTVTDPNGLIGRAFEEIFVGSPPDAEIVVPEEGSTFAVGDIVTLKGKVKNDLIQMTWEVRQHHADHWHPFLAPTVGDNIAIDPAPGPEDYVAATNSFLRVILTATDKDGLSTTVTRDIMPRTSFLQFYSEPSGMSLSVDGSVIQTPSRVLSWENHNLLVEAKDQGDFTFREWSSGAGQKHYIRLLVNNGTVPEYTAFFDAGVSSVPSSSPSSADSSFPSAADSLSPSDLSSALPSYSPTSAPSPSPSCKPSSQPSGSPSSRPSPSDAPSIGPTASPSDLPTVVPSDSPTISPSTSPSETPSATPSSAPSKLPTASPTDELEIIPLVKPSRKDCGPSNPCGRCEGHCRRDTDCEDGLICFYKDRCEEGVDCVPGCSGNDMSLTDWCIVGTRNEDDPLPLLKPVKDCSEKEPCGRCEGRCQNSDECEGDLVCFEKDEGLPGVDAVPGCLGHDLSKSDWCTTSEAISKASQSPSFEPSSAPSLLPSSSPSEMPTDLEVIPLVKPSRKDCGPSNPCGRCEGHCKRDTDCEEGLICFYKDSCEEGVDCVPGCSGSDQSLTDWCIVGTRDEDDPLPLLHPLKDCSEEEPCGRCEGHCHDSDECQGDLVCYEKDEGLPGVDAVPGCTGQDLSKTDWCTTAKAVEEAKSSRALRGTN